MTAKKKPKPKTKAKAKKKTVKKPKGATKDNPLGLKPPAPEDNSHKLSIREFYFVQFYIQEKNGTKATKLAGYKGSDNVLGVQANRMLKRAKIKAAMTDHYLGMVTDSKMALYNLSKLAEIPDIASYLSFRDLYATGKKGEIFLTGIILTFDMKKFQDDGFGHLIAGFANTKYGPRVTFRDPQNPNVWLGKAGGEFIDVIEDKRPRKIEVTFKKNK